MATAASPLRSSIYGGPDYEVLWKRLENRILEIRQNTSDAICVESDPAKIKILQGTWGAYGLVYNDMQRLLGEARGDKPTES